MTSGAYPQGADYQLAMQHPDVALSDSLLKRGTVETRQDRNTIPVVRSGGFVFTYHLLLPDGREKALRCYNKAIADLFVRYEQIVPLTHQASDVFLPTDFQREGILVNGQRYPLLVMEWVRGETLNNWIVTHCDRQAIGSLIPQFDHIIARLEQLGAAHGDLQHGNILVDGQEKLRLIDYDSMYVPALTGLLPADAGQRNFQHPQRRGEFDDRLDRFPSMVIGLALRALAAEPTLWHEFGMSGENLLFTREDFLTPQQSPLLKRLEGIAAVAPYIANFRACCLGRYADVPRPGDFFAMTTPLHVSHATRPAAPWRTGTPVVAAEDSAELLRQAGHYVEIIGRVREVRTANASNGHPYAQLIFTTRAGFVAMIFSPHLATFVASGHDPQPTYVGRWVTMTLVLDTFASTGATLPPRPQVVISAPGDIGILTEAEARKRLDQVAPLPRGFTDTPKTSQTTRPQPTSPAHPRVAVSPDSDEASYLERVQQHWGTHQPTRSMGSLSPPTQGIAAPVSTSPAAPTTPPSADPPVTCSVAMLLVLLVVGMTLCVFFLIMLHHHS